MEFPTNSSYSDESVGSPPGGEAPESLEAGAPSAVIPVVREDWHVAKEVRETGRVIIRKSVQEHDELIEERLGSDTVDVQRITMNQVVDSPPSVRTEDGVTVIPVVKEFLIVTKELRLVEEIRITRHRSETPLQQRVTLRSEQVTVERVPAGETAIAGGPEEDIIGFTETAEEAVVTKTARVVEEVSVSKEVTERVEIVRDTVRRTEIDTEALPIPE